MWAPHWWSGCQVREEGEVIVEVLPGAAWLMFLGHWGPQENAEK